jgi:hypothetical protein
MSSVQEMPARLSRTLREIADATLADKRGRAVEMEISTDPSDAPADVREECAAEIQEIVKRWTGR